MELEIGPWDYGIETIELGPGFRVRELRLWILDLRLWNWALGPETMEMATWDYGIGTWDYGLGTL